MALSHFGRMVFSALIDADRLETEIFYARACGYEIERGDWPSLGIIARQLSTYMAELAGKAGDTPVNRVRAEILGQVRCMTGVKRGFASLTVPTGGGKTFASLVWALGHARAWGLDRIIYVIPFFLYQY